MEDQVLTATAAAAIQVAEDGGSIGDILAQLPSVFEAFTTGGVWVGVAALAAVLMGLARVDVVARWLDGADGPKANWLRPLLIVVFTGLAAFATAFALESDIMGALTALLGALVAAPSVSALISELVKLFSSEDAE